MPENSTDRYDFTRLYRATLTPLRRYLARLLGNATEAQDVAHDAYLRVYPKVQDQSAVCPEAVLYATARRLAINRLHRRSIAPFAPAANGIESAASSAPSVTDEVMARQDWQNLERAIAQLPEGCRAVLILRKIELLSHQEIALRLGIAVSTVEKQHARARRLVRAATAEQSGSLARPGANQEVVK